MDTFYIITNSQKDPGLETACAIRRYLEERGKRCFVQSGEDQKGAGRYRYTDAAQIPQGVECVLVIGGDGTLLQAARDLVERDIPLLGVNMGTLGYLAEVDRKSIYPALDQLLAGEYSVERRMMISGAVFRQSRQLSGDIALNDIVISRNGRLRVVDFQVSVDGEFLGSFTADGIIVSTPTGSTGYNLSAGGPIVAPAASLMLLTAIAPHTLNTRPIVLPDDVKIEIEVGAGHSVDVMEGAEAAFDGDTIVRLNPGDRIVIAKSDRAARMVKTKNTSFLEILREKLSR